MLLNNFKTNKDVISKNPIPKEYCLKNPKIIGIQVFFFNWGKIYTKMLTIFIANHRITEDFSLGVF